MTENTNTDLGKLELVDDLVVFLYDREKKDFSNTKYRVIKAKFRTNYAHIDFCKQRGKRQRAR